MDFQKLFSKSGKNPQSILKIVLGFSFVLLLMWLFLVSTMNTGSASSNGSKIIAETEQVAQMPQESGEESTQVQRVEKKEAPALFQNAFITFLFLVSILGGIWYWAKKREGNSSAKGKNRELDSHQFSENSQLKFLEINEEIWIVGLSENGMNLLYRYPKSEWKEGLSGTSDLKAKEPRKTQSSKGNMDFKSLLKVVSN